MATMSTYFDYEGEVSNGDAAIQGRNLGTDDPTLKSADSGDVIDFYG
jgi:hypothetical protein